jgi:hypothetical protein
VNVPSEKPVSWMMMEILEDVSAAEAETQVVAEDVSHQTTVQNSLIKIKQQSIGSQYRFRFLFSFKIRLLSKHLCHSSNKVSMLLSDLLFCIKFLTIIKL